MSDNNSQKVVLRSMTLRGVGSYLHGARLEIQPLTILCGKNGSGKSTWLKMLDLLIDSKESLPFELKSEWTGSGPPYGPYTNALIRMAENEGERKKVSSYEEEAIYGPLGTIGLHFEATQDIGLDSIPSSSPVDEGSALQTFFWHGRCAKGAKFSVCIAHPRACWQDDKGEELYDYGELRFNEIYKIRFKKRVDVNDTLPAGAPHKYVRDEPYNLSCSQAFLSGESKSDGTAEIELANVRPKEVDGIFFFDDIDPPEHLGFCQAAFRRIRELLNMVLPGFFHLGAIRLPHDYDEIEDLAKHKETPNLDESIPPRFVGRRGEMSIALEEHFAYNRMKEADAPFREFPFEAFVSVWLERLVDIRLEMFHDSLQYESLSEEWRNAQKAPNGFLIEYKPEWEPFDSEQSIDPDSRLRELPYYKTDRFQHGCFGNMRRTGKCGKVATPPRPLSEGFHQIAPMIVQAALMRRYEVLAIENPEVHLHPKLQLEVAEFLMTQAKINKVIIIETHSDLIVRRVLRAILEEEIPQECVRLYFAELKESLDGYQCSTLDHLRTNKRGQIENWPEGFMDDYVKESRRLFDIMYGANSVDDDE
jgi:energy-coupling factor transporter ATP-binding protein EcfA2